MRLLWIFLRIALWIIILSTPLCAISTIQFYWRCKKKSIQLGFCNKANNNGSNRKNCLSINVSTVGRVRVHCVHSAVHSEQSPTGKCRCVCACAILRTNARSQCPFTCNIVLLYVSRCSLSLIVLVYLFQRTSNCSYCKIRTSGMSESARRITVQFPNRLIVDGYCSPDL